MSIIRPAQSTATNAAGGTTRTATLTGVQTGSVLVATVHWNDTVVTITGVSDSVNGAWTQVGSTMSDASSGSSAAQYHFAGSGSGSASGDPTVTVTFSGAVAGQGSIIFAEIREVKLSGQPDKFAQNNIGAGAPSGTDNTTSGTTGTLTTSPGLLYGVCFDSQSTTQPVAGTGFTAGQQGGDGSSVGWCEESKRVTATTSVAATWTATGAFIGLSAFAFATVYDEVPGPLISVHPASQSVYGSLPLTFSVTATASAGSLTYQWYRNGVILSGETSSSYTSPALGYADNQSYYYCLLTDSNGSRATDSAYVTFTQPMVRQIPQMMGMLEEGAAGAMAATASGTGSSTANLTGAGAMAATSAGVASDSSTARGLGAMVGTDAGTSSVTGAMLGVAAGVGTSAGVATQTGDLMGFGAITGTAAGVATDSSTASGTGDAAATSAGVATVSGTLLGVVPAAGTSAGVGAGSGDLTGLGGMASTAAGVASDTATASALGDLVATAAGTSTGAASSSSTGALAATAAGVGTATGAMLGAAAISASASGLASDTSSLGGVGALSSSASGTGACSGSLGGVADTSASASGTSSATASATGATSLAATSAGVATSSATAAGRGAITATSAGTSSVAGGLSGLGGGDMVASSAGTGSATGAMVGAAAISATEACSSTASGALTAIVLISALSEGGSACGALASALGGLTGSSFGTVVVLGSLSSVGPMVGSAEGFADVYGDLTLAPTIVQISGHASGTSVVVLIVPGAVPTFTSPDQVALAEVLYRIRDPRGPWDQARAWSRAYTNYASLARISDGTPPNSLATAAERLIYSLAEAWSRHSYRSKLSAPDVAAALTSFWADPAVVFGLAPVTSVAGEAELAERLAAVWSIGTHLPLSSYQIAEETANAVHRFTRSVTTSAGPLLF